MIHLHAAEGGDDAPPAETGIASLEAYWFVLARHNGHWTTNSKIVAVCSNEDLAERQALALRRQNPEVTYGVAMLRSEARPAAEPFQIVRTV